MNISKVKIKKYVNLEFFLNHHPARHIYEYFDQLSCPNYFKKAPESDLFAIFTSHVLIEIGNFLAFNYLNLNKSAI